MDTAAIAPLLERAGATFALMFGSRVNGTDTKESDIDIAVSGTLVDALALRRDLTLALGHEVDLLHLDDANLPLMHSIVHNGVLLWQREPVALARWRCHALLVLERDYPGYLRMAESFKRRIATRGLLG